MKFQKLDPKQMPQVIALGVISLGAVGYAGFTFLSAKPPKKHKAPIQNAQAENPPVTPPDAEGGPTDPTQPGVPPPPGQYNPDPFRPQVKLEPDKPAKPGRSRDPGPRGGGVEPDRGGPDWPGEALPADPRGPSPEGPAGGTRPVPSQPVQPAGPQRPELFVTGIIDAEDGADMALVELDQKHRIIQVGDVVGNNYRVVRIGMEGVLLQNGTDRYFVALGNKSQAKG
jgi:hypothetical protein